MRTDNSVKDRRNYTDYAEAIAEAKEWAAIQTVRPVKQFWLFLDKEKGEFSISVNIHLSSTYDSRYLQLGEAFYQKSEDKWLMFWKDGFGPGKPI